jgi:DNA replication and repair protein RecF
MLISLIDSAYLNALRDYNIALKNRNALLRAPDIDYDSMDVYEQIMAQNCLKINNERREYSKKISIEVNKLLSELLNENSFHIRYRSEIKDSSEEGVRNKFKKDRQRDIKRGFTGAGPQSDEFEFYFADKLMRDFASTGQCRLISLCIKMAKLNILCEVDSSEAENIIVLVDDVTGELDEVMRTMFFKIISKAGQAFFTFTEKRHFDFSEDCEYYNIDSGRIINTSKGK